MYNYGAEENMVKYGQVVPPDYDLSAITAPVALYYGANDYFVALVVSKLILCCKRFTFSTIICNINLLFWPEGEINSLQILLGCCQTGLQPAKRCEERCGFSGAD